MNRHYTIRSTLAALFAGAVFMVPAVSHASDLDSPLQVANSLVTSVSTAAERTLNYVVNGLAWDAANLAIESMTKSTVNWINSGFQGSPAFVTDLNENFQGVSDAIAARFFTELSTEIDGIATTPFQDRVLDAARLAYYLHTSPESFYTRYPYTLNQVSPDDRAFLNGDFSQGGFNAWFATVMNAPNNPYDARILADRVLNESIGGAIQIRTQELDWSKGFLSWRGECKVEAPEGDAVSLDNKDTCLSYEVKTPGSVIEQQLNNQLDSGRERLIVADDINEIISALLNQLVGQVLGVGGLSGTSRPSSGGGSSFIDRPTETGNSASTAAAFSQTIADQKAIIVAYQANWERIRTAAQSAQARCGSNGSIDIPEVLARAEAALVKAANSIAAYEALETRIATANAAGGNRTAAVSAIATDFIALGRSDTVPTVEEIAEAQLGAQDSGDTRPGSLYSQLARMSLGICSASDE